MKNRSVIYSVKAAARGLIYAYTNEKNFRLEVYGVVVAVSLLIALRASLLDYVIVSLIIAIVLIAELINTALERAVDIIKPHKHPYARVIKDLSAGFVLLSVSFAVIIGIMIYVPLLLSMIEILW